MVRGAVSPDHVHLLVSAPPVLSPAKLAQYLKGRSSRKLQEEFPSLQKRYWGQHLWARGYFCATVGAVDEKTIKRYIEEQKWDEDGEGNVPHRGRPAVRPGVAADALPAGPGRGLSKPGSSRHRTFSPIASYRLELGSR